MKNSGYVLKNKNGYYAEVWDEAVEWCVSKLIKELKENTYQNIVFFKTKQEALDKINRMLKVVEQVGYYSFIDKSEAESLKVFEVECKISFEWKEVSV